MVRWTARTSAALERGRRARPRRRPRPRARSRPAPGRPRSWRTVASVADARRRLGGARGDRRDAPRRCRRRRTGWRRSRPPATGTAGVGSAEAAATGGAGPRSSTDSVRLDARRSGRAPRTASPRPSNASRVAPASEVVSISAPSVSSATPTIPVMFTPRSPSAVATRASEPGRSSSWTVNQTVTEAPPVGPRWYPVAAAGRGPRGTPVGRCPLPPRPARRRRCPTSRSSASRTRRPRGRPSASSRSGGSSSTSWTCGKRPIAPGELRRFTERLGARALLDETSRPTGTPGSATCASTTPGSSGGSSPTRACCGCRSSAYGNEVTAGRAEATWTRWLRPAGGP